MREIQRILFPVDFSDHCGHAAEYTIEMANRFGAQIYAIHVLEPIILPPFPGESLPESFVFEREERAKRELKQWITKILTPISGIESALLQGSPSIEIIRYAQGQGIDLIVMGTHGRTGLAHALIGSVAEKVVRKAPCPVLTVCPEVREFKMP